MRPWTSSAGGIQQVVRDAQRGLFTVVIAEALDHISRDQADVATLYKHLKFAGVNIVTLAEGEISELHVGLKGTMNALFLKDLAMKTHRGLRGRVKKGKAGGGLCYGYRVLKQFDGNGGPVRGDREIIAEEADIIRHIIQEFAGGKSPKAIATDLNSEGIPGPLGRAWGDTSIRGHITRGTGTLNNELYTGVLVWNRQRFIKDPSTGKRVSRPRCLCRSSDPQKVSLKPEGILGSGQVSWFSGPLSGPENTSNWITSARHGHTHRCRANCVSTDPLALRSGVQPKASVGTSTIVDPPSTVRVAPVTIEASDEQRNAITAATSSGWAGRPRGTSRVTMP